MEKSDGGERECQLWGNGVRWHEEDAVGVSVHPRAMSLESGIRICDDRSRNLDCGKALAHGVLDPAPSRREYC